MKTSINVSGLIFVIALAIYLFTGCETEPKNKPPECSITSPSNNTAYEKGSSVDITAEASDPEDKLMMIKLRIDNSMVTSSAISPLNYSWDSENATVGNHEVKATASDEEGNETSATIIIIIDPIILSKPTGLSLSPGQSKITISWDWVDNAVSYNLYWTDDGATPTESSPKITGVTGTSTTHTDLDFSKTYKYVVQAINGEFKSPLSDPVAGSPELPSPDGLDVSTSGYSITLTWTALNAEGIQYSVKRRKSTRSYYSEIASGITDNQYTDNDIEKGIGYYYIVAATDNTSGQTSPYSESCYAVITKTITETERNNANIQNTLSYSTHYYGAEDVTYGLDKFRIKGNYSGTYSIYSAGSYKNYEADCFEIDIDKGDWIEFKMISGQMSGLWAMTVSIRNYYKYTSGNYGDGAEHTFSSTYGSYTYNGPSIGTKAGTYITITMWEDLINYGPYSYEIEITIVRQ